MGIKVLHILNELNYSGAEVMLSAANKYFKAEEIEIHVLSTGVNIGNYAHILQGNGYKIKHIPFEKNLKYGYALWKHFKSEKYDAVHINTERANFWYPIISKICGVKIIVRTVHGLFYYKGFLKIKRTIQRLILRKILKVKFIAISEGVKDLEASVFHNECILIHNWIDKEKFYPVKNGEKEIKRYKYEISRKAFVLITIGACIEIKNHKTIIDIMEILSTSVKDIYYLHVGSGPLEINERNYAKNKDREKNIMYLGHLDNVRDALAASDVLLMPSKYEGLGNAILESLATGVPVIAYNVKSINSVIINGYNGLLCEPNCEDMANTVLKLYGDQELRDIIIQNGFKTVNNKYNVEHSVSKIIEIYKS